MQERRQTRRQRVIKGAILAFRDEYCAVDGVITNISDTGGFVKVAAGSVVPNRFTLHNGLDGYKVDCKVARRVGDAIGFTYEGDKIPWKKTRTQTIAMLNLREAGKNTGPAKPKAPVYSEDRRTFV